MDVQEAISASRKLDLREIVDFLKQELNILFWILVRRLQSFLTMSGGRVNIIGRNRN